MRALPDEMLALETACKAKNVSACMPMVAATFVADAVLAWGGRAPSARR